jgi:hypothetical protein
MFTVKRLMRSRYVTALTLTFVLCGVVRCTSTDECDTVVLEGLAPEHGYAGLMGKYSRNSDLVSFSGPTTTGICFVEGQCTITWQLYYLAPQKIWVIGWKKEGANLLLYSPLLDLRFNLTLLSPDVFLVTVSVVLVKY